MIELIDTTLREGEQAAGVCFSLDQKIELARLLDQFGVSFIETGNPSISSYQRKAVTELAAMDLKAARLAHSRAKKEDIQKVIDSDTEWIGIFLGINHLSLQYKYKSTRKALYERAKDAVKQAKDAGLKIRFTIEDATRTEQEILFEFVQKLEEEEVDRISLADTVGVSTPSKIFNLVSTVRERVKVKLNIHCHNDFGLATANAIAACEAGITGIDCSINGIGERSGITSLAEICLALDVLLKEKNTWKLGILLHLSRILESFVDIRFSDKMPIVGQDAFTHKSGLHNAAIVQNPRCYESFSPSKISRKRVLLTSNLSGNGWLKAKLHNLNLSSSREDLSKVADFLKSEQIHDIKDEELIDVYRKLKASD